MSSPQSQPDLRRGPLWSRCREFICGSFAGVGLVAAGHPFDTIKVRLQSEGGLGRFKGPVHCLVTTLREERVFGLYKGALGPLLGQGTISATQFGLFSLFMPFVKKVRRDKNSTDHGYLWR
jgi:solute carrier family 25 carnitine/acylcarnitine transporter 20/29